MAYVGVRVAQLGLGRVVEGGEQGETWTEIAWIWLGTLHCACSVVWLQFTQRQDFNQLAEPSICLNARLWIITMNGTR